MNDVILINYLIPLLFGFILLGNKNNIVILVLTILSLMLFEVVVYVVSYQFALLNMVSISSILLMYLPAIIISFVYLTIALIMIIRSYFKK